MLRESLSELHQSSHIDVVKKAHSFLLHLINRLLSPNLKLTNVLEVSAFKQIGVKINEIVSN